jgi:hypothetical protein
VKRGPLPRRGRATRPQPRSHRAGQSLKRRLGIAVLLTGAAATTGLGMVASRLMGEPVTEVRALVVHGSLVAAPVLIDDEDVATELHDEITRVQQYAPPYPKELLARRPCLTVAAFLPDSRTANTPAAGLRPEHADASWNFYPAVDHEPAVLGRARISQAQLDVLSRYGLPDRVERDAGAPCPPRNQVTTAQHTP